MKIISVVGARPNFMKIAPFIHAIEKYNFESYPHHHITNVLIHTGQHYDKRMSTTFFKQLSIPEADINLSVGSGTHAEQVGKTMIEFEKVLLREKPDWVVVIGDVNAVLACSITAKKEQIKCCHIEAGLRSGDMSMPEEINRIVADRLSDLLLTPDRLASENLVKEGIPVNKIIFVGNIMIDTLEAQRLKAEELDIRTIIKENSINKSIDSFKNKIAEIALVTLHRPSNVDNVEVLEPLIRFILDEICNDIPLVWPIHPRAHKMLKKFDLWKEVYEQKNLFLLESIGYLEMMKLNMQSKVMLTDSGALQEECTVLGTPCLTLRWNTERPITLFENGGASILVGNNIDRIRSEYQSIKQNTRTPFRPELWDGHTAERCLQAILNYKG